MSTLTKREWFRRSGDEDDTIIVGVDGMLDLSTVLAVEAHVRYGAEPKVVLAASVTDIANREVTVQLGAAPAGWLPTAKPGDWRLTLKLTFNGIPGPLTWPDEGYGTITVGEPG
jgi:hypothetical protein